MISIRGLLVYYSVAKLSFIVLVDVRMYQKLLSSCLKHPLHDDAAGPSNVAVFGDTSCTKGGQLPTTTALQTIFSPSLKTYQILALLGDV